MNPNNDRNAKLPKQNDLAATGGREASPTPAPSVSPSRAPKRENVRSARKVLTASSMPALPTNRLASTEPSGAEPSGNAPERPIPDWKPGSLGRGILQAARRRRYSQPTVSGLVSCGLHAILLILLGMISFAVQKENDFGFVSEMAPNSKEMESLELEMPSELAESAVSQARLSLQKENLDTPPETGNETLGISSEVSPLGLRSLGDQSGQLGAGALSRIRALDTPLDRISRFRRPGDTSNQGTANFFGIQANGNAFVYVVDSSRSMTGRKWERALDELTRSLSELEEGQLFYVIFFDLETRAMLGEKFPELNYLEANADNVKKFRRWSSSIRLGRETFPREAMELALFLRPDAIFLLSDGEFHDNTVEYLAATNGVIDEVDALKEAGAGEGVGAKGDEEELALLPESPLEKEGDEATEPDEAMDDEQAVVGQVGAGESSLAARQSIVKVHTVCFESLVGQPFLRQISTDSGGVFRFVP